MTKNAGWALLIALALAAPAGAAAGDTIADGGLGQRRLGTLAPFLIGGHFTSATDIAIDRSATPNRAYVADADLNRVLGWSDVARLRAGAPADLVLGQPSLFDGTYLPSLATCPAPSAATFCRPERLAVDPAGNLYVVDALNHRVLEFDNPFTTDRTADRVFGQPGFTSRHLPPQALSGRLDVAVDGAGNVWMIDPRGTRRVLELDNPLTHDTSADRVIEPAPQNDCFGASPPVDRVCAPYELAVSPQGDLYVRDAAIGLGTTSLRVFHQPLTTDLAPDFNRSALYETGLAFDPAGDLYFSSGGSVQRFAAPVGPGTEPEVLVQLTAPDTSLEGRMDFDADGMLYIAHPQQSFVGNTGFVFVLAPPYVGQPVRLGREVWSLKGTLDGPSLLAIDRSSRPNRLYAVDTYNRVVGWRDAAGFANGALPDLVIDGGADCDIHEVPVDARHFCVGHAAIRGGLAVDSRGNLWLSDTLFQRVLEFDRPFETDRVLGQGGSFTSDVCNKGGLGAASLCYRGALAFDGSDRLYVADLFNNRVLRFNAPLKDATADAVFGQSTPRQGACNRGLSHPRADTLCLGEEEGDINVNFYGASGLAVDSQGALYVADARNARVLLFRDPLRSTLPDSVLGQDGRFDTLLLFGTGPSYFAGDPGWFFGPGALAVGPRGELYVADTPNNRVLLFADPFHRNKAQRVFGQPDFTSGSSGLPPLPTAALLVQPMDVAVDAAGNLFVADWGFNRVLRFDRP
jgi:DNA-binding beta-propeller fold protein YncE